MRPLKELRYSFSIAELIGLTTILLACGGWILSISKSSASTTTKSDIVATELIRYQDNNNKEHDQIRKDFRDDLFRIDAKLDRIQELLQNR